MRLGLSGALRRTLVTTNPIESASSVTRRVTARAIRWHNGDMRKRRCAAGLLQVESKPVEPCERLSRFLSHWRVNNGLETNIASRDNVVEELPEFQLRLGQSRIVPRFLSRFNWRQLTRQ